MLRLIGSHKYALSITLVLIVLVCLGWLAGITLGGSDKEPKQTIRQGLAGTQIDSIKPTPIAGIYEVKAGNNIFYSNQTGRYLFIGHLYDVARQQDLTVIKTPSSDTQISSDDAVSWDSLPKDAAIITGKKGGIPVAVFLDPDCPYCRALQQALQQNQVLEVHEFLMPLTQLHPNADSDAKTIWCSADREDALTRVMNGQTVPSAPDCDTSGLTRIAQFSAAHGFNATPILIRQDGGIHYGYLPLSELTAWAMQGQRLQEQTS